MPHFRINQPGHPARFYAIRKKLISIGRAHENDIVVSEPALSETQAQVLFDGRDFLLTSLDKNEFTIGNKGKKKHRLEHDDVLGFGKPTLHDFDQRELLIDRQLVSGCGDIGESRHSAGPRTKSGHFGRTLAPC